MADRTTATDRALAAIDDALTDFYVTRDADVGPDAMRQIPQHAATHRDEQPNGAEITLIAVYTRADAIRDGAQIEVPTEIARDAGIAVPVSLTRAAWNDCVAWSDADAERTGAIQDETGRLWDVVSMGMNAARRAHPTDATPIPFKVCRISRDARPGPDGDIEPTPVYLEIVLGADFDGSPCITIMQPGEN